MIEQFANHGLQVLRRSGRQEAGPRLMEAWLDSVLGGPGPLLTAHAAASMLPLQQAQASRKGLQAYGLSRQQLAEVRGCAWEGGYDAAPHLCSLDGLCGASAILTCRGGSGLINGVNLRERGCWGVAPEVAT